MTPLDDLIDGVHGLRGFILDALDDEERRQAARRVLRYRALATGIPPDLRNESVEAMIRVLYGTDAASCHGSSSAVDPVRDTAILLADVAAFIRRFIVLRDEHQAVALALYVLHTHALAAAETTPYLAVLSAEKRSGKSRLLELLARLCARAEHISGASEAALFQLVEAQQPTLLIDEIDAVFAQAAERTEALRGAINSGNRRAGSVIRGGKDGKHVKYATFCPKVLAGIENGDHAARRRTGLPDTVRDRSIPILLRRKQPGVKVERLLWRDVGCDAQRVHDACVAWAAEHEEPLAAARPRLPERLDDRAAEGWEPLLAIADLAGESWPTRAREAALALAGDFADEGESLGVRLLTDLRTIVTAEVMSSADILTALNSLDESPWGSWHEGKGITARELARLLQPYGVSSCTVRIGDSTPKGYKRQDLVDPWTRYLPAVDGGKAPHPPHPPHGSNGAVPDAGKQAAEPTGQAARNHGNVAAVADVADVPEYGAIAGRDTSHATSRVEPSIGEHTYLDCGSLLTNIAGRGVCFGCLNGSMP